MDTASTVVLDVGADLVVIAHGHEEEIAVFGQEEHAQPQAGPALEVAPKRAQSEARVKRVSS
jgi:hypothetical protein